MGFQRFDAVREFTSSVSGSLLLSPPDGAEGNGGSNKVLVVDSISMMLSCTTAPTAAGEVQVRAQDTFLDNSTAIRYRATMPVPNAGRGACNFTDPNCNIRMFSLQPALIVNTLGMTGATTSQFSLHATYHYEAA